MRPRHGATVAFTYRNHQKPYYECYCLRIPVCFADLILTDTGCEWSLALDYASRWNLRQTVGTRPTRRGLRVISTLRTRWKKFLPSSRPALPVVGSFSLAGAVLRPQALQYTFKPLADHRLPTRVRGADRFFDCHRGLTGMFLTGMFHRGITTN